MEGVQLVTPISLYAIDPICMHMNIFHSWIGHVNKYNQKYSTVIFYIAVSRNKYLGNSIFCVQVSCNWYVLAACHNG